jgi:hypothetical protein
MGAVPGSTTSEPEFPNLVIDDRAGSTNQFMPNIVYKNGVGIPNQYRQIIQSSTFLSDLNSGSRTIYVFGRFDYKDTFRNPHWTTFCQRLTPQHAWVACNKYNESDGNK